MGDYRSKSFADGYQMESYNYGDLRSPPPLALAPPPQLKKGKSRNGSITKRSWSMNDPEFQRKKRVASYKVYSVEGKVKGSFKRSFRWLRDKYSQVVYGWW
ncbi:PREDICTED: uncharacterized protein LOC109190957 [Ipomoea nil]|uniref:uncharacterized protein LOC109190957 n=1 Tax=Ipomoea nil TaxID=35883 RepID=UPI000901EA4B|nr:PREDICTED: uncharacterized protein LOC109190957 [Ipomoea nil]